MKSDDERWKYIEMLSELRANYDCFEENEELYYRALSVGIKAIKEQLVYKSDFDKIKDEFISLYPKNYAGEPELGGSICEFSLNKVLKIIDKYMLESEE